MIMNMSAHQNSGQIGAVITDNNKFDNDKQVSIANVSITGAIVPVNTAGAYKTMGEAIPELTSNPKLHNVGPEIYTALAQIGGGGLKLISTEAKDVSAPVQTGFVGGPGSRSI